MKKIFKKLINVLNKKEKSKLYSLQFFNITNAIIEIILFVYSIKKWEVVALD